MLMLKEMNLLGTCPVCSGTTRRPCPDSHRTYGKNYGWYGYDAKNDTIDCNNCGGQYHNRRPTGQVRLNKDGLPCVHQYRSRTVGRCLTEYTCEHCGDRHQVDSGD